MKNSDDIVKIYEELSQRIFFPNKRQRKLACKGFWYQWFLVIGKLLFLTYTHNLQYNHVSCFVQELKEKQ